MADKRAIEVNDTRDDTMNCGLSMAERDVLQAHLRGQPDTMPPRAVWQRIEAQGRAEGLLSGAGHRQPIKWLAGAGLAAAVALVALTLPITPQTEDPEAFPTEPAYAEIAANSGAETVSSLMIQSAQLERNLRALPEQPQLARAGTVATISELQDRVAEIDFWLNHPDVDLSREEAAIYWRERVRLMNSLLRLRTAQAQRMAF